MAMFPLRAQPFFADKNRAFWNLQSAGWAGYFVLRALSGFANGQPISFLIQIIIATITGFSITLVMAVVFRAIMNRTPLVTWGVSILTIAVAAIVYAMIDAWIFNTIQRPGEAIELSLVIGVIFIDLVMLVAWSAMYFGINFYLIVEQQIDRLATVESQATSAQLAMLRYQLNPHFLFNTLNSISTLVLLKQTERANAMLSRLSSFLRYTLANEPTAQVTLTQEFETLKLYLEIEKMRFEDRLRPRFEIDPRVERARLPSLLLQPLVENAIKYAVTPLENGADITITARLAGDRVQIIVSDTGPGLLAAPQRSSVSTGVGLANIRDRLAKAFGPDHRFVTGANPQGGFSVEIEIPLQHQELAREAA